MKRKRLSGRECPIARSLDRVGEWWSILILRDALYGMSRFEQFQKSLDIAPNMLARRLKGMVEAGLLERRCYSQHPPRHEYLPTDRARDFRPVLVALLAWGNQHFAPEGASTVVRDRQTGDIAEPLLVDHKTMRPLAESEFAFAPGPAASDIMRHSLGFVNATLRSGVPSRLEHAAAGD